MDKKLLDQASKAVRGFSCKSVMLALAVLLMSGCAGIGPSTPPSQDYRLTPVAQSPTNVHLPGKFVWHDLLTPDADAARDFYTGVFGWSFKKQGSYIVISNKGKPIGGMIEIGAEEGKEREAIWLAFMSVSDVDNAVAYLKSSGGVVHKGPVDMEHRGRGVLVSDPQGAQLLLLKAEGGDPLDEEPAFGDWLWNEIWSNVPQQSHDFYEVLGEYDSSLDTSGYRILKKDGKWRAGIRSVFEDDFKVRWVPVIRVADPEETVKKVEQKGGAVWVRPDEPPSNGDTALISDSTGALLMIQRWSVESSEGGE